MDAELPNTKYLWTKSYYSLLFKPNTKFTDLRRFLHIVVVSLNYLFRLLYCFKKLPISLLKLRNLSWTLKIFSNPSWTTQTNKLRLLFKFWKISNRYFLNFEQNFQLTSLESNNLFRGTSSHFSSSADLTDSKAESIWLRNFSLTGVT